MKEPRRPIYYCLMLFGLLLALLAAGSLTASAAAPTPLRINCGGGQLTFPDTGVWQADTDYFGGAPWAWAPDELRIHLYPYVQNTTDPGIYLSCRASTVPFSYVLPATPGSYNLRLHFMEGDRGAYYPGFRTFNVLVGPTMASSTTALSNFDVETTAGAIGNALVKTIPVTVLSGDSSLTVTFQPVTYSAMVSAIELIPTGPAGPPTLPPAPTNLKATAGDGQVSLAWDGVAGATSYTVYRATTSGGPYTPVTTPGTVTGASYADTGLTDGTPYFYVVTAVNTVGEGPASNEAAATPSVVVAGTTTLRINAGGGAYTDTVGNVWQADTASTGGTWSFYGLNITGTADPELYRDVRYGGVGSDFSYTLAAAPGTYTLKLHFVEGDGNAAAPGFRTFNVLVGPTMASSTTALSNFDVFAAAGGLGKALVKSVPVTVLSGDSGVTVTFHTLTYGAMVSALELVPAGPAGPPTLPPAPTNLKATAGDGQVSLAWDGVAGATSYTVYRATTSGGSYTPVTTPGTVTGASYADTGLTDGTPYFYVVTAVNTVGEGPASNEATATPSTVVAGTTTLRINAGGGAYASTTLGAFQADTAYTGGGTWSFQDLGITGTSDPDLYRTVRYGGVGSDFSYTLAAAPGTYTLKLHFVEGDGHTSAPGFRTFNVLVGPTIALNSLDVFAAAGGLGKALVKSVPVTVLSGDSGVTVTFHTLTYGAMVSALELVPGNG